MIIVTGASGFIGYYLTKSLFKKGYKVIALFYSHKPYLKAIQSMQIDLTSRNAIKKLKDIKPTTIFHLAALANIDKAEQNHEYAKRLNRSVTQQLASLADELNIPFIFFSTDMVYSGNNAPYKESAIPHPISIYGETKMQAEKYVLTLKKGIVIRTALVFGLHYKKSGNFFTWLIERLNMRKEVLSFTDQFRTPIAVDHLVQESIKAWENLVSGIFNLAGARRISRYDFNILVAKELKVNPFLIVKKNMEDLPNLKIRPKDLTLNTEKANNAWGFTAQPPEIGIKNCLQNIQI